MVWVALGHMYMFGVFSPVFDALNSPFLARNRGDCEKVLLKSIKISCFTFSWNVFA